MKKNILISKKITVSEDHKDLICFFASVNPDYLKNMEFIAEEFGIISTIEHVGFGKKCSCVWLYSNSYARKNMFLVRKCSTCNEIVVKETKITLVIKED